MTGSILSLVINVTIYLTYEKLIKVMDIRIDIIYRVVDDIILFLFHYFLRQ